MYDYYLFDLDGTLTDSSDGIINAVIYALEQFGIREEDRAKLEAFIGPPLLDSFQKYYGFSREEAMKAIEQYRVYYRPKGIYENRVYEGIPEVLRAIKAAGKKVGLVTSKPEAFAVQILEHFGLLSCFDEWTGATMDESRCRKDDILAYGLDHFQIENRQGCVMIGDREYDILAAKKMGIDSIGVLYGFGDLRELTDAGATHIAATPQDLLQYL